MEKNKHACQYCYYNRINISLTAYKSSWCEDSDLPV